MKVIRNTPEQLILRSAPWLLAIMFCGFIVASVGFGLNAFFTGDRSGIFWGLIAIPAFMVVFILIFIRRDEVILDRSRDLLELRHSTFFGRQKVQHNLIHLEKAIVQTSNSGDNGPTHRIALVLGAGMDAGTHPVTPVYVSGNGAKRAADLINGWLSQDVDLRKPQA